MPELNPPSAAADDGDVDLVSNPPGRGRGDGFTLIELLVVVVIVGVLAAIAVPVYLSQREKGYRSVAVSDMKNVQIAAETYATENDGSYAGLDGADEDSPALATESFNASQWVSVDVSADVAGYCILGVNAHVPGKQFVLRSTEGSVSMELLGSSTCP